MSIRNRFTGYVLRVMRGSIRPAQLANLARSRLMPKAEVVSWQPTHLSVFVTDRCTFSCDMCPTHSKKVPKSYVHRHHEAPDMAVKLLRFVLDRYPRVIRVELIGTGEPLLNPQFFDLVRECVKRRKIVDSVSNGYKLDSYVHDIIDSGLDRFCISVNGHTAKEFHRMTANPEICYPKILENVEGLVRARGKNKATPEIKLSFIIDRYNYNYMGEMVKVAEDLCVDATVFFNFLPSPYPGFKAEERCIYADDPDLCEELRRLASRKFRCRVTWPSPLMRWPSDIRGHGRVCRWPFRLLQVDGAGNVGGCPVMMVNMRENGKVDEEDPWNNQYFIDLRRRHLQSDVMEPCRSCSECVGLDPGSVVKDRVAFGVRESGRKT